MVAATTLALKYIKDPKYMINISESQHQYHRVLKCRNKCIQNY